MADLNDVLSNGGIIKVKGTTIFVDNPDNLNYYCSATGYSIINANGWRVYFKCRERRKAQELSDLIFGKGKYIVMDKI